MQLPSQTIAISSPYPTRLPLVPYVDATVLGVRAERASANWAGLHDDTQVSLDPLCGLPFQLLKISGSVRNSKLQQFISKN